MLLLTGCPASPASVPPPTAPTSVAGATVDPAAFPALLTALSAAVRTGDRTAFDAHLSTRDPAFAAQADRVFSTLTRLQLRSLSLRAGTREGSLSAARRALLGPGARSRQVLLDWRLTADSGPAHQRIWLTVVTENGRTLLAGQGDGDTAGSSQPLWLLEPTTVVDSGPTTVLAGSPASAARWARRAGSAARAVRAGLSGPLAARWNGRLVVEVPSTATAFEHRLGVAPGSYAQIAAVTWPDGPDPSTAALRVVVNPGPAAGLDEQGAAILLTHEATHVATRAAASRAPLWLVEGFADRLAYDAHPARATAAAAPVLDRVRAGRPVAVPPDRAFGPGAPDLDLAYAEGWLACRFLADTTSPAALDRLYRSADAGTPWPAALRTASGLDQVAFTARWHAWLRSMAGS